MCTSCRPRSPVAVLAGVHDVHLRQLQQVLNAAARPIARKRKYDSISATLRDALHWLPIRQRVEFKLSVLVFCLHNLAPSYLSTMCQPVADNAGRRYLCSAARGDLAVPATRTLRYGPRSFAVAGPSTWILEFSSSTDTQLSSNIRVPVPS